MARLNGQCNPPKFQTDPLPAVAPDGAPAGPRAGRFFCYPLGMPRFVPVLMVLLGALSGFGAEAAGSRPNVLLISIDTLRADRVGAYGYRRAATPNLDRLAREGVLFERVITPVPLTLPAHASLLTSLYPPRHGVRDNGEVLGGSVPTLAEQFHGAGYETAAFVGAFVLDRRFGLGRGFDVYWSDFRLHQFAGADPGEVQVRGDRVEAAAEQWLRKRKSAAPFFLFLHFFDLHGPYLLPAAWRGKFPGRVYDGELAYVDDLIGRFLAALAGRGLANNTLVVATSDHGEGLGDHGERNHGFFVYLSTTRVPLLVRLPGGARAGTRVRGLARLVDIGPTICALAGVPPKTGLDGRSLADEIAGRPLAAVPAYSETLYPFRHFHSSPLYALRDQSRTYIQAPRPELYDLAQDPGETRDRAAEQNAVAASLRGQLTKLVAAMQQAARPPAPVAAQVAQQLRSLGYAAGASSMRGVVFPPPAGADPKDRIALYTRFQDALEQQQQGAVAAAVAELEQMAATDPALFSVQIEAGVAWQRLGQHQRAADRFRAALAASPESALGHYNLGISLSKLGRNEEADRELNLAVALDPSFSRAHTARGLVQAQMGQGPAAVASFDRALAIDPNDFEAWLNRGAVRGNMGEWQKARQDLERAAALEPASADVHQALGTQAFLAGDTGRALREYSLALKLAPRSSSIHSNLGLLYRKSGRHAEAEAEFRKALELDPGNQEAAQALRAH